MIRPPLAPMLARLARELPEGDFHYEPKWDGFRALVFREASEIDIRSRKHSRLSRYFPELVAAFEALTPDNFLMDGEIVIQAGGAFDFPALMLRLHPAASRVERLSRETPATFVAFDLLAVGDRDLRPLPFHERRSHLEALLQAAPPPIAITPATRDRTTAARWLEHLDAPGVDGIVAKHLAQPYEPGRRTMIKVKAERTADCVVAGYRLLADARLLGSLLLGLYDRDGSLRHVGVAASFTDPHRRQLAQELASLATSIRGHPWERGFGLGRSPLGRLAGSAGRWDPDEMPMDWVPVRPERVCEVVYDKLDGGRFRHPAGFRRWRPDRDPASCTFEQFEIEASASPFHLVAGVRS